MDMTAIGGKIIDNLKKYRYVIMVLAVGIGLMLIPDGKENEPVETTQTAPAASQTDPAEDLTQILAQIQGAGKVKVLLTVAASEKTVYQTDQDNTTSDSSGSIRVETVLITDADRAEQALVQQTIAAEYRGAIIVCQGADNAAVRLAIVEAVANATGLGADRISVLKMK